MIRERTEVRIAGTGGQGVVTAGRILAESAILSGLVATHSQAYGPQSRGGASRSDVVISRGPIGFPLADHIDVLVALSAEAADRYVPLLGADSTLILDDAVATERTGAVRTFGIVDVARRLAGSDVVAGVVALGVLEALDATLDGEALRSAVTALVGQRHRDMNLAALDAGALLVQEAA